MSVEISYGKSHVSVYRMYASPMVGLTPIPESSFTDRENALFAVDVDVEVFGDNFMPAYTEGDNSSVVATDTMKNFILNQALLYQGSTLEGFLDYVGRQFLTTYPHMQSLRMTGREQPFAEARVPSSDGFTGSGILFSRSHDDYAFASLDIERGEGGTRITDHKCGRLGFQLIKITGSSFASFVRDQYTTLPERVDRPLFIYLDVYWKYADAAHAVAPELSNYISADQVRDFVQVVFHDFVSMSIQHLVYEMGVRLLKRFPQMAEVSFIAQNHLWDVAFTSDTDPRLKVYTDPRPPYGRLTLTLPREKL